MSENARDNGVIIKVLHEVIGIEKNNDVTQTGYYLCKGIDTGGDLIYDAVAELPSKGTNIIIIRYAEVLLGYADREVIGQPYENVLIGAEGLQTAIESAVSWFSSDHITGSV